MIQNCSCCGKPFLKELDAYGPVTEPRCFTCFMEESQTPEEVNEEAQELIDIKERLEEIDEELDDLEKEQTWLENRLEFLKAKQVPERIASFEESQKLSRWKVAVGGL